MTPRWLQGPLGSALLQHEQEAVADALDQVFGLSLVQVGQWGPADLFVQHARTRNHAVIAPQGGPGITAVAEPERLGIASDSVDAVLLPHTLELHPEPHRVLREAARVLVGDGHLLVIGLNPWSGFGLRRLMARGRFPSGTVQLISERRLRDWLSLLGFEVCSAERTAPIAPFDNAAVQRRLGGLGPRCGRMLRPVAGVYLLVARKRVYSVTPMRPAWTRRPRVAATGLVEPTTRSAA